MLLRESEPEKNYNTCQTLSMAHMQIHLQTYRYICKHTDDALPQLSLGKLQGPKERNTIPILA